MASVSSFPATLAGYKSYLKSVGITYVAGASVAAFALTRAEFDAAERRTLEERGSEFVARAHQRMITHNEIDHAGLNAQADLVVGLMENWPSMVNKAYGKLALVYGESWAAEFAARWK